MFVRPALFFMDFKVRKAVEARQYYLTTLCAQKSCNGQTIR
jgi:hypothetical protein